MQGKSASTVSSLLTHNQNYCPLLNCEPHTPDRDAAEAGFRGLATSLLRDFKVELVEYPISVVESCTTSPTHIIPSASVSSAATSSTSASTSSRTQGT